MPALNAGSMVALTGTRPTSGLHFVTKLRLLSAAILLASIVALLAGCGGGGSDNPTELTGLIVDIKGRGNDVSSFTLRTGDRSYEILLDPDIDYGFQPAHLRVHASALYPVRCKLERREGRLYALEIVDV
jgi:hypothetical protein